MGNKVFLFIIVIGIITIINFCGKSTLEAQQEGQDGIKKINVSQIAFFYDKNSFANSIEELEISDKINNNNYEYSIILPYKAAFSYAIPRASNLKIYIGGVYFDPANTNESREETSKQAQIQTIICEANVAGKNQPELPIIENGIIKCGKGTTQIGS